MFGNKKGKSSDKSIHIVDPKTKQLKGRVSTQGKDDTPTASATASTPVTAPKPVMSTSEPGPEYKKLSRQWQDEKRRIAREEEEKAKQAELSAKWLPLKSEDLQSIRQNAYDVTSEIANKFLETYHQPKFNWEDQDFLRYKQTLQETLDYLDLTVKEHQAKADKGWADLPAFDNSLHDRCRQAEQAFNSAYFKEQLTQAEEDEVIDAYIEVMRLPFFKSSHLKAKFNDLDEYIAISGGLNRAYDVRLKNLLKEAKSKGLILEEERLTDPEYRQAKQVLNELWLAGSLLQELNEYGHAVDSLEYETFYDEYEDESSQEFRVKRSKKNLE